jgi:hypothetical protein
MLFWKKMDIQSVVLTRLILVFGEKKKETSKKESFHNTSGSKYAYSVAEDENKIGEVQLSRNGHEKDSG